MCTPTSTLQLLIRLRLLRVYDCRMTKYFTCSLEHLKIGDFYNRVVASTRPSSGLLEASIKARRFSDQDVFLNAVDQGPDKGIRSGLLEVGFHIIYRSNIPVYS